MPEAGGILFNDLICLSKMFIDKMKEVSEYICFHCFAKGLNQMIF